MAFNGYFIKANGNILPSYLIARKGYKSNPNIQQDLDSYRDGDGELHRNVLTHKPSKVWIKTISPLMYSEKLIIQSVFPNREVATVEYWNDESNSYQTAKFYIPDIDFTIDYIDKKGRLVYTELEITLVGY
jgi:hypothetical protein